MKHSRMISLIGLAAALLLAVAGSTTALLAQGKTTPTVSPASGVPGVRFTFVAGGFRGAVPTKDADENMGEQLAYWINTPGGVVISTEPLGHETDYGSSTKPLIAQANGHGEATIDWRSPLSAEPGLYSMVIHGLKSDTEVVIPFAIQPAGSQTVVQTDVTPRVGDAGGEFRFVATGFEPGSSEGRGSHGEKVAYWFNTPDGGVISTEPRSSTSDYGSDTKPLLHYADDEGVVNLVWSSPETLQPGIYSVVFHGLDSQHQVLMFFTIR